MEENLELILGYSAEELHKKNIYYFMEETAKNINIEAINKLFIDKEEQILEKIYS